LELCPHCRLSESTVPSARCLYWRYEARLHPTPSQSPHHPLSQTAAETAVVTVAGTAVVVAVDTVVVTVAERTAVASFVAVAHCCTVEEAQRRSHLAVLGTAEAAAVAALVVAVEEAVAAPALGTDPHTGGMVLAAAAAVAGPLHIKLPMHQFVCLSLTIIEIPILK
jgi:hypothetical protein